MFPGKSLSRNDVSRNGAVTKCHADAAMTDQSVVTTTVGRWTSSRPPECDHFRDFVRDLDNGCLRASEMTVLVDCWSSRHDD